MKKYIKSMVVGFLVLLSAFIGLQTVDSVAVTNVDLKLGSLMSMVVQPGTDYCADKSCRVGWNVRCGLYKCDMKSYGGMIWCSSAQTGLTCESIKGNNSRSCGTHRCGTFGCDANSGFCGCKTGLCNCQY